MPSPERWMRSPNAWTPSPEHFDLSRKPGGASRPARARGGLWLADQGSQPGCLIKVDIKTLVAHSSEDMAPDTVDRAALERALENHVRFGDTDVFPPAFELPMLQGQQAHVVDELASIDLSEWTPQASRALAVPKPDGTYRISQQLNAIDSVLYLAALLEHSATIERARVDPNANVAFSYRLTPSSNTSLFDVAGSWQQFEEHSKGLAENGSYKYVLLMDFADFYNQIYVHRVQSCLELAGVPGERASNIEKFLLRHNGKNSQGIPVGPAASIIISEVILNDFDRYVMSFGATHARFADDFRVFFSSYRHARTFLEAFSRFAYEAHRLALQPSKTRILKVTTFSDSIAVHEDSLIQRKKEAVGDILHELLVSHDAIEPDRYGGGFRLTIPSDELENFEKRAEFIATSRSLAELFQIALENGLNIGVARYCLSVATKLRVSSLISLVLQSKEILEPAIRLVCLYLDTVFARCTHNQIAAVRAWISDIGEYERAYCRCWFTWLMMRHRVAMGEGFVRETLVKWRDLTQRTILEGAIGNHVYFNEVRGETPHWSPESQRAFVAGLRCLPRAGRRAALASFEGSPDLLCKFLVRQCSNAP